MGDGSDPGVWDEAEEESSVCGNPDQPWQRPNCHDAPLTHDGSELCLRWHQPHPAGQEDGRVLALS